jgi:hypothetical protein
MRLGHNAKNIIRAITALLTRTMTMLMTRPEGKKNQEGKILSEKSRLMQNCDAILRSPRHISDATGFQAALDLTFADLRSAGTVIYLEGWTRPLE